ncbi:MAG TPA: effector-associated domain EAD1-containing protein [Thermoanaerobaculia bacterium]|nr:effector-associated domain EAD1-containing protein [Thermoanaerobaculia bacterium]
MTERLDPELERAMELTREKLSAMSELAVPAEAPEAPEHSAALEAATVVSRFQLDDLEKIADEDDVERVLSESLPVADRSARGYWTILPDVRRMVLQDLMSGPRLGEALAMGASITTPDDALRNALVRIDAEGPLALETFDLASLSAVAPFAPQLQIAKRGFPSREDIDRRVELLRLLEPFNRLTREGVFGREKEFGDLRAYVDVLESEGFFESVGRAFAFTRQKPLLITGVGGVGKSTLIARFIVDHARAAHRDPFPFAYLDFDRRSIMADEPASILVEAIRQIALQFPHAAGAAEELRRSWRRLLAGTIRSKTRGGDTRARDGIRRDFVGFVEKLGVDPGLPVLLVLDTFEEVQYRNRAYLAVLRHFLDQLGEDIPRLRVVIAGRATVPEMEFAKTVKLEDFDEVTSLLFLSELGVTNRELGAVIRRQVGGNPLTLRLAAAVFRREGEDPSLFKLAAADRQNIQGQLFTRILRHIHDEDVRKIAHPGLVLRRVTPDIIRHVLAEPCELHVPNDERAREIFELLEREVALVSAAQPGVVEHRSDVRRLMLRSLHETEPLKVPAIHRAAASYYHQFEDPLSRAEQVYHLLWLQERDEARSRYVPEAKPYLLGAIEELPLPEQAFLADLMGDEVPSEARASATLEIWERSAERRVSEHLRNGDTKSALAVLAEEPRRSTATLLRVREAAVYLELEKIERAASVLEKAPEDYTLARNWLGAFEALMMLAQIAAKRGDPEAVAKLHCDAEEVAAGQGNELWLVRVLAERARTEDVTRQLIDAARRVEDGSWSREPALLRRAAAVVGAQDVDLVAKAARLAGGYALNGEDERRLEEVLASRLRRLETVRDSAPIWARIQRVFDSADRNFATLLATVLAAVFGAETERERSRVVQPAHTAGPKVKADLPTLVRLLDNAGLQPHHVGDLLVRQFERNLASISFETERVSMYLDVLRIADREGWLARLLDAVRPIAPAGTALLSHLDTLGIGVRVAYVGGAAMRDEKLQEVRAAQRPAIGVIEHRICRIEVKGKFRGTGFLVGSGAVLTAPPTVMPNDADVVVRFDYGVIGGKAYNEGIPCSVATVVLVPGLPAVLLELTRGIASEPVGGANASRFAPVRRLFDLSGARPLDRKSALFWFWHTDKEGLHMTGSEELTVTDSAISMYANDRTRFAGSPCFDADFRFAALHCGPDPNRRREALAVPASVVARAIEATGHGTLLGGGTVRLTSAELQDLRTVLLEAFTRHQLEMLLSDTFDMSPDTIAAGPYPETVFSVVQHMLRTDRILEFLDAVMEARPDHPRLALFARRHLAR